MQVDKLAVIRASIATLEPYLYTTEKVLLKKAIVKTVHKNKMPFITKTEAKNLLDEFLGAPANPFRGVTRDCTGACKTLWTRKIREAVANPRNPLNLSAAEKKAFQEKLDRLGNSRRRVAKKSPSRKRVSKSRKRVSRSRRR